MISVFDTSKTQKIVTIIVITIFERYRRPFVLYLKNFDLTPDEWQLNGNKLQFEYCSMNTIINNVHGAVMNIMIGTKIINAVNTQTPAVVVTSKSPNISLVASTAFTVIDLNSLTNIHHGNAIKLLSTIHKIMMVGLYKLAANKNMNIV